jgi:pentapeptide MXKDX repeat protein
MNKLSATLLATCMVIASVSAFAADEMKKDAMGKDAMSKDEMKK